MTLARSLMFGIVLVFFWLGNAFAYEINNHADMTERAALISKLNDQNADGKLRRLGLSPRDLGSEKQKFLIEDTLPQIRYCYGEYLPGQPAREYDKPANAGQRIQDPSIPQPLWNDGTLGSTQLTIAQLFRYGACYEDAEEPFVRPRSHFYNPQDAGAGVSVGGLSAGPSSLDWMLKPGASIGGNTNHFGWPDARQSFYKALTTRNDVAADVNEYARRLHWGKTFQSLGHILHHLQDMASPQHTRNDAHCNDPLLCASMLGSTLYRPSAYEYQFDQNFQLIRNLASSATAPILFGLPREFWNINTTDSLSTNAMSQPATPEQGIAAYTSSNFTSVGKDFSEAGVDRDCPIQSGYDVNASCCQEIS
jgi:hypothetical protein